MTVYDEKDAQKYCSCMDEVRIRLDFLTRFLQQPQMLDEGIEGEIVCLQLRKIVELIAFSSLTANRAAYERLRANFVKDKHARYIFRDIERSNPNFYPKPLYYARYSENTGTKRLAELNDGFATKDDLIFLYEKTSLAMHARNPYIEGRFIVHLKYSALEWVTGITRLLALHSARLLNSDDIWIVILRRSDDGKPHVLTAAPA